MTSYAKIKERQQKNKEYVIKKLEENYGFIFNKTFDETTKNCHLNVICHTNYGKIKIEILYGYALIRLNPFIKYEKGIVTSKIEAFNEHLAILTPQLKILDCVKYKVNDNKTDSIINIKWKSNLTLEIGYRKTTHDTFRVELETMPIDLYSGNSTTSIEYIDFEIKNKKIVSNHTINWLKCWVHESHEISVMKRKVNYEQLSELTDIMIY